MRPAAEVMKNKIDKIIFNNPLFKIMSNVTTKPETEPEVIKKLLVEQIFFYSQLAWWNNKNERSWH